MDYLIVEREYDIDDLPSREDIPELKADPSLDMAISAITETRSCRVTIYDPARLPLPEREYIVNRKTLLRYKDFRFRPTEKLTRAKCNTIAGRTKLLDWERTQPRLENGVVISGNYIVDSITTTQQDYFTDPQFTPQQAIEFMLHTSADPETKKWVFNGLWANTTERRPLNVIWPFHPDLFFANIEGHDITNRDQFHAVIEKYATDTRINNYLLRELYGEDIAPLEQNYTAQQVVDTLLNFYDDCQRGVDGLWATYELFRTENFVSIVDMSKDAQRAAVRNYLYLYRNYNTDNGTSGTQRELEYNGRVTVKVRNRIGIPPEIWKYAEEFDKKPSRKKGTPTPDTPTEPTTDKTPIYSQEQDTQRVDYKGQFELIFNGFMGRKNKITNRVLDEDWKHELVTSHTQIRKLCVEMIHAIETTSNFDVYEYAKRVNDAKTKDDLLFLMEHPFIVNVENVIKNVWGKMSQENRDRLKNIIKALPDESFIVNQSYTYWDKKQRKHIEIRLTPSKVSMYRGRKGFKELEITQPRFTWQGWVKETNGRESQTTCLISVNPVFFAKMIGSHGELTNYIKLTPEYMEYIRQIPNTKSGFTMSAVEIILNTIRKARLKKYNTSKAENKTDILTFEITQDEFFDTVCRHVPQSMSSNIAIDNKRMREYILKALETLKKHRIHIEDYKTSKDRKKWTIKFLEPS